MASAKQDLDTVIHIARNFNEIDISLSRLEKLARIVCDRYAGPESPGATCEVGIAVVGDAEIQELNAKFLDCATTTDCLSFDLSDETEKSDTGNQKSKMFELIVNGEMAVREADLRGHSSEAELALYITHGLLHNLGFDDSTPEQARTMHDAEDEILQQMGYGFVYNKSVRAHEHESTEHP